MHPHDQSTLSLDRVEIRRIASAFPGSKGTIVSKCAGVYTVELDNGILQEYVEQCLIKLWLVSNE